MQSLGRSDFNIGKVGGDSKVIEVTCTTSNGVAYAAGDQVGALLTLTDAVRLHGGTALLQDVVVLDKSKQKAELDVFIFDASPTVASSDNAAADVTDAEMVDKCSAVVKITVSDYYDLSANSTAHVGNLGRLVKAAATDSKTLYALVVTRGTPTYTSTTDLVFRFKFLQD